MKKSREHFVTCGQMKILEKRADEAGLSYYQMMENAGTGAAEIILEKVSYRRVMTDISGMNTNMNKAKVAESTDIGISIKSFNNDKVNSNGIKHYNVNPKSVVIFCGKGNNGGDGFVVARILNNAGYHVTVVLVDGLPKTESSITNFKLIKDLPIKIIDMTVNEGALMELKGRPEIVIDAIYGTGFHGKLQSNALKAAIYINRFSKDDFASPGTLVFALDIPSGLGGDLTNEKELDASSVTAHYTITFHAKKPVHLQKFAAKHCGEIIIVDIGIDEDSLWNIEY